MKKLVSVLMISVLSAAVAFAAAESADSAYHQKRYQDAIKIYESQLEQGTSSDLYYNLGCCYYKTQDIPKAILCFERALVLDAANDDARSNLSFVRQKSKIEENEPGGVLENILKNGVGMLSSNAWALLAGITFVVMLLAIAAYIFMDSILWRKVGFFGAGLLLVAFIASMACAFYQRAVVKSHRQAIVMPQNATLSKAPHTPSEKEVAYQLTGGTKVCIVDSVVSNLEKKETWSYSKTMNLNRFDMYKFMQSANEVAEAFTSEKNLYGYDKYNHLCVNKDLANRKSVTIPLSFNRSIWITPIVIRSEETKIEMEGVAMCFDKVTNYVALSYDEFKFLLYYLDKVDLESLSLQLITFAQLTEGKTFTSIDNLPDAREFASAQIPDKEPQNEESVSGFIPVISDETLPKI